MHDHAGEILEALEAGEEAQNIERGFGALPPAWVAEVYDAVFKGVAPNLAPAVMEAREREAHEIEDQAIGSAFRDALLADLNGYLRRPDFVAALSALGAWPNARSH